MKWEIQTTMPVWKFLRDQRLANSDFRIFWPYLSKFWQFGKILGSFSRVHLPFGKMLNLLRQIIVYFWAIFQGFIDVNGQMLNNNLAIWSHCFGSRIRESRRRRGGFPESESSDRKRSVTLRKERKRKRFSMAKESWKVEMTDCSHLKVDSLTLRKF